MQAYKTLYPDKAQGTIFGPETIGEKSRRKKDLDAMEIDKIQRRKRKAYDTIRYVLEKALRISQRRIIQ